MHSWRQVKSTGKGLLILFSTYAVTKFHFDSTGTFHALIDARNELCNVENLYSSVREARPSLILPGTDLPVCEKSHRFDIRI